MSLNVGEALQEGVGRTVSRVGALLVAAWAVLGALNLLAYNSALLAVVPDVSGETAVTLGPALPISPLVAGVVSFVLYLVSFVFVAAALRTFVADETPRLAREYVTHNVAWMLVNLLVGYVVFFVVVWVGFLLLFVPGIFLLVSLYFWFVDVVVEDQNFVSAFRNSWALAKGDRWSLLALGVIAMAIASVLVGGPYLLAFVLPPWAFLAVYSVATGVYGVFGLATTARAYVQLAAEGRAGEPAVAT